MIARAIFIMTLMVAVAAASAVVSKAQAPATVRASPSLESAIPDRFGDWTPVALSQAVLPPEFESNPGETVIYRAWRNRVGRVVTVVIAYGPPLGDSVRLHRPEICYRAQGFALDSLSEGQTQTARGRIPVVRLEMTRALRHEAVTYWLRDGDRFTTNPATHEILFFQRGFQSHTDGALVRISSTGRGAESAFALHDGFIRDFVSAMNEEARTLLLANAA